MNLGALLDALVVFLIPTLLLGGVGAAIFGGLNRETPDSEELPAADGSATPDD